MSFRDNIRLGNINATDQEVEEAAKAGLPRFLNVPNFPSFIMFPTKMTYKNTENLG